MSHKNDWTKELGVRYVRYRNCRPYHILSHRFVVDGPDCEPYQRIRFTRNSVILCEDLPDNARLCEHCVRVRATCNIMGISVEKFYDEFRKSKANE